MELFIWLGTGISLAGLAGLIWCIYRVWRVRRADLGDAATRAAVQKVMPLNAATLFLSVIGLMLVVLGVSLG